MKHSKMKGFVAPIIPDSVAFHPGCTGWITIFILSLLMYLTGCSSSDSTPTPPLIIPFALHQAGTVLETDVEIEQGHRTVLDFRFYVNNQPGNRDWLLTFLGAFRGSGTPIPLKVQITKHETSKDVVILEKIYTTVGTSSLGQTNFDRQIDKLDLKSGIYRVRLETIEAFPQLSDTAVDFGLYYFYRK
jgi:hypothetical protein